MSFRSKFLSGAVVYNPDWGHAAFTVVVGTPDANGKIVVVDQFDEYSLVRQADLEALDE